MCLVQQQFEVNGNSYKIWSKYKRDRQGKQHCLPLCCQKRSEKHWLIPLNIKTRPLRHEQPRNSALRRSAGRLTKEAGPILHILQEIREDHLSVLQSRLLLQQELYGEGLCIALEKALSHV